MKYEIRVYNDNGKWKGTYYDLLHHEMEDRKWQLEGSDTPYIVITEETHVILTGNLPKAVGDMPFIMREEEIGEED